MNCDEFLTVEDVSRKLHISAGTARNRLSRGEAMPPSIKVGRRRLFPEADFLAWLENYRCESQALNSGGDFQ